MEYRTKELEKLINLLTGILETHEKYKSSFFWKSGTNTMTRRKREQYFPTTEVEILLLNEVNVTIRQNYIESANNCYYRCVIYLDDIKKDIRLVKKITKDPSMVHLVKNFGELVYHSRKHKIELLDKAT